MAISGDSISGDIIPAIPGMPGVPIGGYIPGDSAETRAASYAVPAGYPYALYATASPTETETARARGFGFGDRRRAYRGISDAGVERALQGRGSQAQRFERLGFRRRRSCRRAPPPNARRPRRARRSAPRPGIELRTRRSPVPCLATSANRGGAGARVQ